MAESGVLKHQMKKLAETLDTKIFKASILWAKFSSKARGFGGMQPAAQ